MYYLRFFIQDFHCCTGSPFLQVFVLDRIFMQIVPVHLLDFIVLPYCHTFFVQLGSKQNHFNYKLLNQITFCINCQITLIHSQGPTADLQVQNYHVTNGDPK